jgi:hypothetical protein
MSSHTQLAYDVLWFAHPVLEAAVAAAMLRRKLYRVFPVFFSYLVAQIAIFVITYPIYRYASETVFFDAYWTGSAISVFLGFKVIHEIFLDVCRPYHTLKDLGTMLFRWAGLVMLLVAIVVAVSNPTSPQAPLVQAILTTQRCVRVIQVGLVLFLLVFSKYLGVSWRQHSFGIALGFGAYAAVELAIVALKVGQLISQLTLDMVNMTAYNCALGVWLIYALSRCPGREVSANLLRPQRWEQSLTDLQHPVEPDSLIPLFEGMVDRALSRTNGASHQPAPDQAEANRGSIASRTYDLELPSVSHVRSKT